MPPLRRLNDELQSLRHLLLDMTDRVDAQLADALNALLEHDVELAEVVADRDRQVDALELEIDRQCERLLALHAPVAADLRTIITAVKVNTDLERIGDHCRNLARNTPHVSDASGLLGHTAIPEMADISRTMLRRVQEAFLKQDRLLARKVIASDLQVNRLHAENFEVLVTHSQSCPQEASAIVHLLAVSKALERIADHVKNIAGNVVFLIEGVDLRRAARPAPEEATE
ncbi:MAG: phosphate signaling complex protein PhoU [Bacteroidetes bacterium]|jgi:phosphate transport system protein|nr:phosphate signaling complex protein PhoU [Bacteroidota bacterium]